MKYLFLLLICFFIHQPEEQAPDFKFITEDRQIKNLSDYKGQVVYLSLWASWCKPCISNFQKYKDLRKELASEGVVLLNVSIDTKEAKWQKALTTVDNLNGINAYPFDYNSVIRAYDISRIPAYHIIDKNGNFVYLSDKQNRNVLEEFKAWLN